MKQKVFFAILVMAAIRLLGSGLPAADAQETARIDVTGNWAFRATTSAGSFAPTATFQQSGEVLTGKFTTGVGEADLAGTVKGRDIAFTFALSGMSITYAGTIESNDAMKGTVDVGGGANGTFTASRQ